MPVCQVCQHDNPAGAEFCEDCGAALKAPVGASTGAGSGLPPSGPSGESIGGAPSAGTPTVSTPPSASTPSDQSAGGTTSPGAQSASATSPDALGEAGASVGTTLSGAGDVGVASEPVEAASPNAQPASAAGAGAGSAASPSAGAPATGSAADAATSQAGAAPTGAGAEAPSAGVASGAQQARLVAIRYGAPTGQEIPLLGQRLVVGRFDPETGPVDVDLSELGEAVHVSRQHGELYRDADGRWTVRDLGSTNGIFVKGSADGSFGPRITAPRQLTNGDEVTFGNARFVFRTD
jgi:hypothetical protein